MALDDYDDLDDEEEWPSPEGAWCPACYKFSGHIPDHCPARPLPLRIIELRGVDAVRAADVLKKEADDKTS